MFSIIARILEGVTTLSHKCPINVQITRHAISLITHRFRRVVKPEDRVREVTSPATQAKMDWDFAQRIRAYALRPRADLSRRILELEQEWDIERWIEMNASLLAFSGVSLALFRGKRWLVLPAAVTAFLFQHAVQGWCPPVPLLRRLGVRTRQEILRELYALKALRGDFSDLKEIADPAVRAQKVLDASIAYS
jgi:hypothetical protein